jgi:DNA replication ATP-dependent helicase Dna2
MPARNSAAFLARLTEDMHREVALNRQHLQDIWSLPLHERVEKGHSLGPLKLLSLRDNGLATFSHQSQLSRESFCALREGDMIRLTRDDPANGGPTALFLHDDGDEIALSFSSPPRELGDQPEGYTIDPDFFDPTDRFLAALDELARTEHGREDVLPILMGEEEGLVDTGDYFETSDALEENPEETLHESQLDAIANCVAAQNFHLVQGPPGTGKTHVLARVATLLVEKDHRLLITGPTHRAIQNALSAIRHSLPESVPVVKIGGHPFFRDPAVPQFSTVAEARLPEGSPYVIGATPYALWSNFTGLAPLRFDTALLDEASQLTVLLAALAMLRADRFLFFGDHYQLPPVRLGPAPEDENDQSIFARLSKSPATSLLTESWRLNTELAAWPSATFYNNELTAKHDRRLTLEPASQHPALQNTPSLVAIPHDNDSSSTLNHDEAETAAELIHRLLKGGLAPGEIAVITPFRAQAARIRGILRRRAEFAEWTVADIVCDTIERLQGQEREVILLTFTASHATFIERLTDFLFQPQRLNVAVTRARRKTIILYSQPLLRSANRLAERHHGANVFCSLLETASH